MWGDMYDVSCRSGICKEFICKQECLAWHSMCVCVCVCSKCVTVWLLSCRPLNPIQNYSSAPFWSFLEKHTDVSSVLNVCSALTFESAANAWKSPCFSLKPHFVHLSVILISQGSLCPKVQDIRKGRFLSLRFLPLCLCDYLSINQSIFLSLYSIVETF